MKITLINPPIEDFYITSVRRQPIGLLYIASYLKKMGHEVELINCHTPKKHKLEIPAQLSYLKEFIDHKKSDFRFPFGHYQRFGMSYQAIREIIKNTNSELYLISSLFSTYYEEVEEIISLIKKYHPKKLIAAGGYHPSLFPEDFIRRTGVDAVIKGEGEYGVTELIQRIKSENLNPETIIEYTNPIKELDGLLFPDRTFLLERDFNFYKKRGTAIIASRGCPNSCSFCTSRKFWNGFYNSRSIENVIEEIDQCVHDFQIRQFNFEDDNLFINKERAKVFLEGLIRYQELKKISLDFSAMNGISIENIDAEIINLMNKAGFKELNLSLVTSSIKHQKKLNRPFSTFKFNEIVNAASSRGMNVRAYYILGLPKQDKSEIVDTINYIRSLKVQSFPSVFYNITEKHEEWKMQRSSAFYNETEYLSRKDLIHLFNYNYLKV